MLMKSVTEVKVRIESNVQVQITNMEMIKKKITKVIGKAVKTLFLKSRLQKVRY